MSDEVRTLYMSTNNMNRLVANLEHQSVIQIRKITL